MPNDRLSDNNIAAVIQTATDPEAGLLLPAAQAAYRALTPREQDVVNRNIRNLAKLPKVGAVLALQIVAATAIFLAKKEREDA